MYKLISLSLVTSMNNNTKQADPETMQRFLSSMRKKSDNDSNGIGSGYNGGNDNNQNGGGNMEDYVTHRELQSELEKQDLKVKNQFTETNSKINELEIKMNSRFNKIDARFDNINDKFDSLPEKIENIVMKNNQERDKEQKETRRYLWGTIFIGTVSMIISIIALF